MPPKGSYSRKELSSKEWHKELLLSWLFRTCFKLQAALDRRFLDFGLTFREAAALMRCVEGGETVPSRLAITLGKDKGKMTRLVDRLEAAELVKRLINPRDAGIPSSRPLLRANVLQSASAQRLSKSETSCSMACSTGTSNG